MIASTYTAVANNVVLPFPFSFKSNVSTVSTFASISNIDCSLLLAHLLLQTILPLLFFAVIDVLLFPIIFFFQLPLPPQLPS